MTGFNVFGLPETLITALTKINFTEPTPIQAQAIPPALKGQDVLGTASTGTGKTAAFALPLITHLLKNPKSLGLIMTPTRELASQVLSTMEPLLLLHRNLVPALLIGGEPIGRQLRKLDAHPRLLIGTPGRINDHLARGSLWLDRADFLVLDETDRMLDMGFGVQIEKIIAKMAKPRQTLMFSATLPPEIVKMAQSYLKNPQRITIGTLNKPVARIKQEEIHTSEVNKYGNLIEQLEKREGSIIVFVKTRHGADRMAKKLIKEKHSAEAIHGDLQQKKRERVIQGFRDSHFRILVATDVAARGLDIPHIEHVINYDLPQCPEDYIHRIGRTARAGAEGQAVSMLTPADFAKWKAITRLINPEENRNERANRTEQSNRPGPKSGGFKSQDRNGPNRSGARKAPFGKSRFSDDRAQPEDRNAYAGKPAGKKSFGRNPFAPKEHSVEREERAVNHERAQRSERPSYNDGPRGERSRADAPRSGRSYNDRPRSDVARGERTFGDRPRPRADAPLSERTYGDRPRSDAHRGERSFGDRPRSARTRPDAPRSERTYGDRPRSDAPRGERSFADRPRSSRPADDRPRGGKPSNDRARTNRSGKPPSRSKKPTRWAA